MNNEIVIAGFGGQGVLFAGKLLAYTGMMLDKEVSWLPSYGPEMRGGTCNCHIILKDDLVGSPVVVEPTEVIALNGPSFQKFENSIVKGGKMIYDSTLIDVKPVRDDIEYIAIPATKMADDINASKLANMIITGKMIKETGVFTLEEVLEAVKKLVPASKPELLELNQTAIKKGYEYNA